MKPLSVLFSSDRHYIAASVEKLWSGKQNIFECRIKIQDGC